MHTVDYTCKMIKNCLTDNIFGGFRDLLLRQIMGTSYAPLDGNLFLYLY